ncbi:MAG: pyruvate ferredoxin oxidoreductase [Deltaproteobacteria bacterium]|nr:pyruvate ferredoxin oxidoreductase [Deltaproteobacteria bacterium]
MKQQIIISGLGGQGALTLTRLLAEAAAALGLEVITSETHGMAQRGGAVISMVKVGPFRGPLIPAGSADLGLFLTDKTLPAHRFYLKPGAAAFVSTAAPGDYFHVDGPGLAARLGLPAVAANLALLGYVAGRAGLFCGAEALEQVLRDKTPERFRDMNLQAFKAGLEVSSGQ